MEIVIDLICFATGVVSIGYWVLRRHRINKDLGRHCYVCNPTTKKLALCLAIWGVCFLSLSAQQAAPIQHAVQGIARATGSSIKLRWAPNSITSWQQCNRVGYRVARHTFKRNGKVLPVSERSVPTFLSSDVIRPWPEADSVRWRELMQRNNYAAIGAQALYGESFEVGPYGEIESDMASLINKAQEDQNRYSYALFAADQSFEAARAMGLALEDPGVLPGEEYVYLIYPAIPGPSVIDTAYVLIGTDQTYALPKVVEVEAEFGNRSATISWNQAIFRQYYTSYQLERSLDGVNFTPANDLPFVQPSDNPRGRDYMMMVDTFPENDMLIFYRVRGKTPFEEFSPPSDMVQGMGIAPQPVRFPNIDGILPDPEGGFRIGWEFEAADEGKITGFELRRSRDFDDHFVAISGLLPPDRRTFVDPDPLPTNYYQIVALDAYGREMPSFEVLAQLDDETPPAVPVKVRGTIMEDGKMVLSWQANQEADLLGYRVFMANNPDAEFTQITRKVINKNFFIDSTTLNTLNPHVFIRVKAYDYRHNASDFSETAVINRPDTIAPSAPIFRTVEAFPDRILLEWENSSSPDLDEQLLQRRTKGDSSWIDLTRLSFPESQEIRTYDDSTGTRGTAYEYQLVAIDYNGLRTASEFVEATVIDNGIRESLKDVTALVDRRAKTVQLQWKYPADLQPDHFIIYRGKGEQSPLTYEIFRPATEPAEKAGRNRKKVRSRDQRTYSFTDKSLQMNTQYTYRIKAVFADGGQSPQSDVVPVSY